MLLDARGKVIEVPPAPLPSDPDDAWLALFEERVEYSMRRIKEQLARAMYAEDPEVRVWQLRASVLGEEGAGPYAGRRIDGLAAAVAERPTRRKRWGWFRLRGAL